MENECTQFVATNLILDLRGVNWLIANSAYPPGSVARIDLLRVHQRQLAPFDAPSHQVPQFYFR
jgi:hypothetical protein